MTVLIYGANGYTGELVARRAARQKLPFLVSGRRAEPVRELAAELGVEARVFDLRDSRAITGALEGVAVVLNCAGPFTRTAEPLVTACLASGAHYLDVTAELTVLESLARKDEEAKARGVTLLPATGFDVVPSDCLAAHAKHRLPSALYLALAFEVTGRMSRGTATTAIENAHAGGFVRSSGALVAVPSAHKSRDIDFGRGPKRALTIPWGDLCTAYHSTGIPNIEVYAAGSLAQRVGVHLTRWLRPLLASKSVQRAFIAGIERQSAGPTHEERASGVSRLWAEARDDLGGRVELRLQAPEPYELTSWTAVAIAERALKRELPAGFQTPSRACGRDFILSFPRVSLEEVARTTY